MGTITHTCGHQSRYIAIRPNPGTTCPTCSSDFVTAGNAKEKLKGQFAERYQQAQSLDQSPINHHYPVVAQYATICRYECVVAWSTLTTDGYDESYIRELIKQALTRTEAHAWIYAKGSLNGLKAMAKR